MRRTDPIKVLIVDDSPFVRSILTRVLSEHKGIRVVAGAKDPYEAREFIIEFRPDVIILDVEMPRMDGLTFLRKLQVHYPVPVIICSGVTPANGQVALEAIASGAVDVLAKPRSGGSQALRRLGEELAEKICAAAVAMPAPPPVPASAGTVVRSFRDAGIDPHCYCVAIGASTGGTEAIKNLLSRVPADFPATAIVQHMPMEFTRSFAERLDQFSAMSVSEAVDGEVLGVGKAVVVRGGVQMSIGASGGRWRVIYGTDEPVNRHCPAVDVLFDSVARQVGNRAVGILLTGMGADGAKGLLGMRNAGALTIAQDQESSVVYGMPKVAVDIGAVQRSAPPSNIPAAVVEALRRNATARAHTVK